MCSAQRVSCHQFCPHVWTVSRVNHQLENIRLRGMGVYRGISAPVCNTVLSWVTGRLV